MPKGSTQTRLENIAKEGAVVDIQEMNYDDCVRLAAKEADETPRGVMVQDTAWDGYEEIPSWIMQGYGTMAIDVYKRQGLSLPESGWRRFQRFQQALEMPPRGGSHVRNPPS